MTIDTQVSQPSIQQCLLIELQVSSTTTYYISNNWQQISYGGNTYTQLGYFLQMSEMQDDIKPTSNQVQVALAGVPSTILPDFAALALNTQLKGSEIRIRRAFFNNNQLVDAYLRFSGYVSNYSLSETWDDAERMTSFTVSLQCTNLLALTERQYTGRRTNEKDQKIAVLNNGSINSTDTGMDRVKILADSSFDFGKKD
jgi:hypothetical protein